MKPSWDDAPEWANYLAMDKNEIWYWFAEKPRIEHTIWDARDSRYRECAPVKTDWKKSLEARP